LRFLGSSEGIVGEDRVVKSLRLISQHRNAIDVADQVIPLLIRHEDWSQLDCVVALFKAADKDHQWVRPVLFNYLRVCPKPETLALIEELKEIDPKAFHRTLKFFGGVGPQKRIVQCTNSWDLWDIFAPTSRDWDMYD
jgi:hypothetical protein